MNYFGAVLVGRIDDSTTEADIFFIKNNELARCDGSLRRFEGNLIVSVFHFFYDTFLICLSVSVFGHAMERCFGDITRNPVNIGCRLLVAVEQGMVGLAVIGVVNSALSLYYYLRVVVAMYMRKGDAPVLVHDDAGLRLVLLICLLAILWLGFGPAGVVPGVENVLEWTRSSLARVAGAAL